MQRWIAAVAATSLLAAPASAGVRETAFSSSSDRPVAQTAMFAGASYRLSLDGRSAARHGEVSLRFAGMTSSPERAPRFGEGLAFSSAGGTPRLTIARQDARAIGRKAQLGKGGTVALVVIGVVVVAGAIVALSVADDRDNSNNE